MLKVGTGGEGGNEFKIDEVGKEQLADIQDIIEQGNNQFVDNPYLLNGQAESFHNSEPIGKMIELNKNDNGEIIFSFLAGDPKDLILFFSACRFRLEQELKISRKGDYGEDIILAIGESLGGIKHSKPNDYLNRIYIASKKDPDGTILLDIINPSDTFVADWKVSEDRKDIVDSQGLEIRKNIEADLEKFSMGEPDDQIIEIFHDDQIVGIHTKLKFPPPKP
jgi:hypothetical protein